MRTRQKPIPERRGGRVRRIIKWGLVAVVVVIVLLVFLLPAVVSSERFGSYLLARINRSVAGEADFADLSMGWIKGVRVEDLSFNDDAGQFSLKVKKVATRPHYASLLAGNLSFGRTTIDEPRVQVNLKPAGGAGEATRPGPKSPAAPAEVTGIALVSDVVVNDGSVKVTDAEDRSVEFSNINTQISLRPPGSESTFSADMTLVAKGGGSKIRAAGRITPKKAAEGSGWTLKDSDGQLSVQVDDLDVESLEVFLALAGLDVEAKGRLSADFKGQVKGGRIERVDGTVRGSGVDVTAEQFKGDRLRTDSLDVQIKLARKDQAIDVERMRVKTDWADVTAAGVIPTSFKSLDGLLDPNSGSELQGAFACDVAALAGQMPRTLGLKEGTQVTSGRVSGQVATAAQGGRKQLRASAELVELKGKIGGKDVAFSQPVRAVALVSRERVSKDKVVTRFDELNVSASFAKIGCTGTTEDLKYDAEVDLGKLQAEFGQFVDLGGYRMAGRIVESGQVSVGPELVTAAGTARIRDLSITSPNDVTAVEPRADIAFAVDLDRQKSVVVLKSVNVEAGLGKLGVEGGKVPFEPNSANPMDVVVKAEQVDLAKVGPFAVMFGALPEQMKLAGLAESEVAVSVVDGTYKIKTDNTRIKDFELSSPGKKPFKQPEVTLVADLEVDPNDKTFTVRKLNLQSEKIKVDFAPARLSRQGETSTLVGKANLEYDWAAVCSAAGGYWPRGLDIRGRRTTSINFASRFPRNKGELLLANLSTNKCSIGFDKVAYKGLDVGPTDLSAQFDNGVLKVDPFSSSVNQGRVSLAADADFTRKPTVIRIPGPISIENVRLDETLSYEFQGLLAYLNPVFKDFLSLGGMVNFSAERIAISLSPTYRNDMEIVGTVEMRDLRIRPTQEAGLLTMIFSLIGVTGGNTIAHVRPTKFTVKDGFVRYDDMQVDFGGTVVHFAGVVGLDKTLDMQVGIPLGGKIAKGLGGTIPLPLTGTIDKPKLDKEKLPQDLIKGLFRGLLDEGRGGEGLLDGLFK